MKAITVKQPWASLICAPRIDNPNIGIKDIENRKWKTKLRGRIYVHASQAWNAESAEICITNPNVRGALEKLRMMHNYRDESIGYKGYSFSGLECGAIIGEVDIVDCVINHESIWAEKTDLYKANSKDYLDKIIYNWVLANPILYEKPIPCKGKLSFWEPDFDIVECIGCENKFNYEDMTQDDAGENYCPECWTHFKPILKADLEQAIREGGIDPLEKNGFSFETGV